MANKCYMVVDIGGTEIKYGVIDDSISFIEKGAIATNAHLGGKSIIQQVIILAKQLRSKYPFQRIAIATAGQVNPFTGEIVYASDAIPDYRGINVIERIQAAIDVEVTIENDVNCALLAERTKLPKHKNVVMVTVGTGIGGALYIHDQILRSSSFSAGEIGYINVNGKPFQECASVRALIQAAKEIVNTEEMSGKDVFELSRVNKDIKQLIETFYDNLATGFASIIYVVAPDYFIIGGAISARDAFIDEIKERLIKILPKHIYDHVHFIRAAYQNDAGMIGAYFHSEEVYDAKKNTIHTTR